MTEKTTDQERKEILRGTPDVGKDSPQGRAAYSPEEIDTEPKSMRRALRGISEAYQGSRHYKELRIVFGSQANPLCFVRLTKKNGTREQFMADHRGLEQVSSEITFPDWDPVEDELKRTERLTREHEKAINAAKEALEAAREAAQKGGDMFEEGQSLLMSMVRTNSTLRDMAGKIDKDNKEKTEEAYRQNLKLIKKNAARAKKSNVFGKVVEHNEDDK